MSFQERLRKLRLEANLTQQQVADKLGITRQAYGYYESEKAKREPDQKSTQKLAELFNVSVDYLLGSTESKAIVAGQEISLTEDEFRVFNELKKHPIMFHDLASNPEKKVKELIKLYKMRQMFLEDDDDEIHEDGFGDLED